MKKTLIGLFIAMFSYGVASAEAGFSIGVSGVAGIFGASGSEKDIGTDGTTSGADEFQSRSEYSGFTYGSIFVEGSMGPIFVGVDYVPGEIETEESSTTVGDKTTSATSTQVTNTVKVGFDAYYTAYVGIKIFEDAYIKVGTASVDVTTKESLGTGSTYGNTSLDGGMVGAGVNKSLDNGMFIRAEVNYTEFDGVKLVSDTAVNEISLDSLDGLAGKISIGKTF
mgnify:FL=1